MFEFIVKLIFIIALLEGVGYLKEKRKGEHKRNKKIKK